MTETITPPPDGTRGGVTFDEDRDGDRLNKQARAVWRVMRDGNWHTLEEIERVTGHPQASVSARLRDFRKPKFGGHTVERHNLGHGLWIYRVTPNETGGGGNA